MSARLRIEAGVRYDGAATDDLNALPAFDYWFASSLPLGPATAPRIIEGKNGASDYGYALHLGDVRLVRLLHFSQR
jgi:hypothetical protein